MGDERNLGRSSCPVVDDRENATWVKNQCSVGNETKGGLDYLRNRKIDEIVNVLLPIKYHFVLSCSRCRSVVCAVKEAEPHLCVNVPRAFREPFVPLKLEDKLKRKKEKKNKKRKGRRKRRYF